MNIIPSDAVEDLTLFEMIREKCMAETLNSRKNYAVSYALFIINII